MSEDNKAMRDVCQLLGGLLLEGADVGLLGDVATEQVARRLGGETGGELGAALQAMQDALDDGSRSAIAVEYTRLMVATADECGRHALEVPPWEDCWRGKERQVLGERSRAALEAYARAGLGFDDMKQQPADHVGLELCFVAALLADEASGQRNASARASFVQSHLAPFAPAIGAALRERSRHPFWREAGRALEVLPRHLDPGAAA